jgi:hypothetical protein
VIDHNIRKPSPFAHCEHLLKRATCHTSVCKVQQLRHECYVWRDPSITSYWASAAYTMSSADVIRQAKIKTSSLKRLHKELAYYEKERDREASRFNKLKEDQADPHDLRQAVSWHACRICAARQLCIWKVTVASMSSLTNPGVALRAGERAEGVRDDDSRDQATSGSSPGRSAVIPGKTPEHLHGFTRIIATYQRKVLMLSTVYTPALLMNEQVPLLLHVSSCRIACCDCCASMLQKENDQDISGSAEAETAKQALVEVEALFQS